MKSSHRLVEWNGKKIVICWHESKEPHEVLDEFGTNLVPISFVPFSERDGALIAECTCGRKYEIAVAASELRSPIVVDERILGFPYKIIEGMKNPRFVFGGPIQLRKQPHSR